jgi:hypothetical protein
MNTTEKKSIWAMAFILPVVLFLMSIAAKIEKLLFPLDQKTHLFSRSHNFYDRSLHYGSFETFAFAWSIVGKLIVLDIIFGFCRWITHAPFFFVIPYPGLYLSVVVLLVAAFISYSKINEDVMASDAMQIDLPNRVEQAWKNSQIRVRNVKKLSPVDYIVLSACLNKVKENSYISSQDKGDTLEALMVEWMKIEEPQYEWTGTGAGTGQEFKIAGRKDAGVDVYGFRPSDGATYLISCKNHDNGIDSTILDSIKGVADLPLFRGIRTTQEAADAYRVNKSGIREDLSVDIGATFNRIGESSDGEYFTSLGLDGSLTYIPKSKATITSATVGLVAQKFTKGALETANTLTHGKTVKVFQLKDLIREIEKHMKDKDSDGEDDSKDEGVI